jgi:hypothetical protein
MRFRACWSKRISTPVRRDKANRASSSVPSAALGRACAARASTGLAAANAITETAVKTLRDKILSPEDKDSAE